MEDFAPAQADPALPEPALPEPAAAIDPPASEPSAAPEPHAEPARARGSLRRLRKPALGMGLLLSVVVGASGSILTASESRGPVSYAAAGASARAASASPAASPAASATAGTTSPTPAAASTIFATPAAGTARPATLTYNDLMLDSAADPGGAARTFAFTTDGPGRVSAQVVGAAPLVASKMCIAVNGGAESCSSGATPGLTADAPAGDHARWVVTLIALDAGSTPVVDVAFSWQTKSPAITLSHGPFRGSPNPDSLRGMTATFKTRATGNVSVGATWPPAAADAALTLADLTVSGASTVDKAVYAAAASIEPAFSHVVKAGRTYRVRLSNLGTDDSRPDLSITISFP